MDVYSKIFTTTALFYYRYATCGSTAAMGNFAVSHWTDILISNKARRLLYEYLIPVLYLITDL